MIELYKPEYKDLWFRKTLLCDSPTMAYNNAYGGTIDFSESKWAKWFDCWVNNSDGTRFYRYLQNDCKDFVGEIAYRLDDEKYIVSVIVHAKYRGNGYGREGLRLLCEEAKNRGIKTLYDDISVDNPSIAMFLKEGFVEAYRTPEIVMLKKDL